MDKTRITAVRPPQVNNEAACMVWIYPTGPELGEYRSTRGGGRTSAEGALRTADRSNLAPDTRYDHLGFRCAVAPGE